MGKAKRRQHSSSFKSKVALEALRERESLSELSSRYGIHSNQLRAGTASTFERDTGKNSSQERLISSLDEQIGQLQLELNWLKKRV